MPESDYKITMSVRVVADGVPNAVKVVQDCWQPPEYHETSETPSVGEVEDASKDTQKLYDTTMTVQVLAGDIREAVNIVDNSWHDEKNDATFPRIDTVERVQE